MKTKLVLFPILAFLSTTSILYAIGNSFELPFLDFQFNKETDGDGSSYSVNFSSVPILMGLLVSIFLERKLKIKYSNLTKKP